MSGFELTADSLKTVKTCVNTIYALDIMLNTMLGELNKIVVDGADIIKYSEIAKDYKHTLTRLCEMRGRLKESVKEIDNVIEAMQVCL